MIDPSLRFTTVILIGDTQTAATQYIWRRNTRFERDGPLPVHVLNRDLRYRFLIEPASRTYTAGRVNEDGGTLWVKPRKAKPVERSGKTVYNHIETIDTGERKELFGYPARRVITKTRQIRDSEMMSESECDGWYIDPPAAWANLHPPPKPGTFCYIRAGTQATDDYKFTETGKRETGFAILTTRKTESFLKDEIGNLKTYKTFHKEEVIKLSEETLTRGLFVPPPDFKQVLPQGNGPWWRRTFQTRLRWEMLKDSYRLPKRIAAFMD